jgi:acetoin utilization protein AcuB
VTRVNEIMSGNPITVDADASCHDAVSQMVRHKIRHLPVVEGGLLCGIVTDRDVRHLLFQPDLFAQVGRVAVEQMLSARRVRQVMSTPVISVGPGTELSEAARIMADDKLGSLPVVERGRIVGIVTETDVLRRVVGRNACCADVETIVVSYP